MSYRRKWTAARNKAKCDLDGNDMKTTWKAYRIENENDFLATLRSYDSREGAKPCYATVSTKAPEWLAALMQEQAANGIEIIERSAYLLPLDVWLTHENQ